MTHAQPDDRSRAGFELFKAGDFAAAVTELTRVVAEAPDDTEVLRTLGMSHYRLEQYDQALEYGRRLVEVAPTDPLSYTTLSLFLQKNGFIKEAEDASAKAKVLTWRKELKEGPQTGPGLDVVDTTTVSDPVMPTLSPPPKKKPEPPPEDGG